MQPVQPHAGKMPANVQHSMIHDRASFKKDFMVLHKLYIGVENTWLL